MRPDDKTGTQDSQRSTKARKIFTGRTHELDFFVEQILKPDRPAYTIISVSGPGGIGKTELLHQFRDTARSPEFKDYCLTAWVDEHQPTPAAIMEKFAKDLPKEGDFEKALNKYKLLVLKQKSPREAARDTLLSKGPEFVGALAGLVPVPLAGGLLKTGVSTGVEIAATADRKRQELKDIGRLEDPVGDLARAFVQYIKGLTEPHRGKNWRRVMLFFDTFEQLAPEAVPWLLNDVLPTDLKYNIVLVVGGRDPIGAFPHDDHQAWLPYENSIYSIALASFTEEETHEYLKERGITEPKRVEAAWQSSRGLPLYLNLLTSSLRGEIDPTREVVVNFLRWIPPEENVKRRLSVDGAFFSRPFIRDDLEAFPYLPKDFDELDKLYDWLISQDFVALICDDEDEPKGYSYKNLVRELFSYYLYQRSRQEYYATREALAGYYQRLLEIIESERGQGVYDTDEWLELAQALVYQLLMLPDEASHVRAIDQVLVAFYLSKQKDAMLGMLHKLAQGLPDKQVTDDTREVAEQLIQYMEADLESPAFLAAANFLLEKAARVPFISPERLDMIHLSRGVTCIALDDPRQAIKDFTYWLEHNAEEGWIYSLRGLANTLVGDNQTAIKDLKHALELEPNEGWMYKLRGLVNAAISDTQSALKDFERALELDPDDAWIYAYRSLVYLAINEFKRALEDSTHALEMAPNEALLYCFRGFAHLSAHQNQQAIDEDLNRAIELAPNVAFGYLYRGYVYAIIHEEQLAIEDLDRAISLIPDLARAYAYALRGYAYVLLNRPEQAIKDCKVALAMAPHLVLAYLGRGSAYKDQHKLELAIADFDHALELAPNFDQIYIERGFAYYTQYKLELAVADFSHVLELAPNAGTAYSGRGLARSALNQFEQAIEDGNRAVELDPKNPWVYCYRGMIYRDRSDFQQAIRDFNQAAELDPKLGQIYSERGLAYASMNEPLLALQDCDQALELNQWDTLAYIGRAAAHIALNEFQQAITDCNQALELVPHYARAYLTRGWAYFRLDESQEALNDFNQALELEPTQPRGYLYRGFAYASFYERQQAFEDLDHALELAPNLPQVHSTRGQAYLTLNDGEFEQAIENFTHALELAPALAPALAPSLAIAYAGRGGSYYDLKQYERAIKDYRHVLELDPENSEIYFRRGHAYLWLGDLK